MSKILSLLENHIPCYISLFACSKVIFESEFFVKKMIMRTTRFSEKLSRRERPDQRELLLAYRFNKKILALATKIDFSDCHDKNLICGILQNSRNFFSTGSFQISDLKIKTSKLKVFQKLLSLNPVGIRNLDINFNLDESMLDIIRIPTISELRVRGLKPSLFAKFQSLGPYKNITKLRLEMVQKLDFEMFPSIEKLILNSCDTPFSGQSLSLKTLNIRVSKGKLELDFRQFPNLDFLGVYCRNLILRNETGSLKTIETNVESLEFFDCNFSSVGHIWAENYLELLNHCSNLEELHVDTIESFDQIKNLNKLKKLSVSDLGENANFEDFENLEELKFFCDGEFPKLSKPLKILDVNLCPMRKNCCNTLVLNYEDDLVVDEDLDEYFTERLVLMYCGESLTINFLSEGKYIEIISPYCEHDKIKISENVDNSRVFIYMEETI